MAGSITGASGTTPQVVKPRRKSSSGCCSKATHSISHVDGGTSFGWMNGANIDNGKYEPTVTSYDYDVPVSESGELRPKYFLFRDVIREATGITHLIRPHGLRCTLLRRFTLTAQHRFGILCRRHTFRANSNDGASGPELRLHPLSHPSNAAQSGTLKIDEARSYAQVYLDGVQQGTIDRRLDQSSIELHSAHAGSRLDILVEYRPRELRPPVPA